MSLTTKADPSPLPEAFSCQMREVADGMISRSRVRAAFASDPYWASIWSADKPEFSNADGSHCTALGRYQINNRAYSNWGVHVKYYLTGLDVTNNKALGRQIVFHSWELVPEKDVYPSGTPEGWGCPAISNNTMKLVDPILRRQNRHVLMWIYN